MKPAFSKKMGRWFLTDRVRDLVDWWGTPHHRMKNRRPVQKPVADGLELIRLPERADWNIPSCDLVEAIASRESQRRFSDTSLRLDELGLLLWSTQGVRKKLHGAAVCERSPLPVVVTPLKPIWWCCGWRVLYPVFTAICPLIMP